VAVWHPLGGTTHRAERGRCGCVDSRAAAGLDGYGGPADIESQEEPHERARVRSSAEPTGRNVRGMTGDTVPTDAQERHYGHVAVARAVGESGAFSAGEKSGLDLVPR
jgi:hypothetical protein